LSRLETSSFRVEKIIDAGTNYPELQQFLFGDQLLLIAQGEVIAGFDLSKISDKDIKISGETLTVNLPAPEILVVSLDNNQTRVYDRRQGLLSKGNKDLESTARTAAEKSIKDAACEGRILDEATKNGRTQLNFMLKSLGFTTVILNIPTASC
jgi:hypothetical protein